MRLSRHKDADYYLGAALKRAKQNPSDVNMTHLFQRMVKAKGVKFLSNREGMDTDGETVDLPSISGRKAWQIAQGRSLSEQGKKLAISTLELCLRR